MTMEKIAFEKNFAECLEKNFAGFSKYFEFKNKVFRFRELDPLIFQVNKCLILELHSATITLTNHILERLLKLGLIYNEASIGAIPVEKWNSTFMEPNRKYSNISLGNSIELCRKFELITTQEKEFLFDIIRELMRNGFSHSDPSKILAGLPDETVAFHGSFSGQGELNQVSLNQKVIPFFQAEHMENFAKVNSSFYFDYVFELIDKIENRLIEKQK
jgi:hypothetical protein